MIRVLYFASLGERLGCRGETLDPGDAGTVEDVVNLLKARGSPWTEAFEQVTVMSAVNQQMADARTAVRDGDELALFPPVTGG
jgi:molybdopterin synthase sulfur carrier subunit